MTVVDEILKKYPDDVARLVLADIRVSFEKHAGFKLTEAEWANLRHSVFSSIQGHFIHNRDKRASA